MTSNRQIFTSQEQARITFAEPGEQPAAADTIGTIRGYALVWNVLSSERPGGYKVRLLPGSATFLKPTFAIYHHDYTEPLARTDTGTLRILPADDYGQAVEVDLPNTQRGRDVLELVRTRTIQGYSFAMATDPVGHMTQEGGVEIFNAERYDVDEISPLCIPAFTETTCEVKPLARIHAALQAERYKWAMYKI